MSKINIAEHLEDLERGKLGVVGLSGVAAVTAQSLSLSWVAHIFEGQKKTGESFTQMLRRVSAKGVANLYRGEFSRFRYTALARFGDLVSNVAVMDFFRTHRDATVKATPIFAQTLLSWGLASVWRMFLLPVDILGALGVRGGFSAGRFLAKLKYRKEKRVRADIVPLYSWFLVQNYLMEYTESVEYGEDAGAAVVRNSLIGFASMSAFDLYKTVIHGSFKNQAREKYVLSGRGTLLKGLHGVVFCNVTQLFAEVAGPQAH